MALVPTVIHCDAGSSHLIVTTNVAYLRSEGTGYGSCVQLHAWISPPLKPERAPEECWNHTKRGLHQMPGAWSS